MEKRKIKIKVIGIGGGGGNAVDHMLELNIPDIDYYVANTDLSALQSRRCKHKICLGKETTRGLGAGGDPDIGRKSAQEALDDFRIIIADADIVFLIATLGGGTGTGAAPVFAEEAKALGKLVICITTTPFPFERRRIPLAQNAIHELAKKADTVLVISNEKVLSIIGRVPLMTAFREADQVMGQAVLTIADLMGHQTLINIDFADLCTVMKNQGKALIGIGMAQGAHRAIEAARKAIESPLLEDRIQGAKHALINITGSSQLLLEEAEQAVDYIRSQTGNELHVIFGVAISEQLNDQVIVSVVASGISD